MGTGSQRAADDESIRAGASPSLRWNAFLADFLFILVAWTVVIKYLSPFIYAAAYGEPLARYIFWDLWPIAHVWLGWALLRNPPYTRGLAIGMSVIEIIIIVSLFAWFLADPDWSIWRTNWFINKFFVLICFIMILWSFTLGHRRIPLPTPEH